MRWLGIVLAIVPAACSRSQTPVAPATTPVVDASAASKRELLRIPPHEFVQCAKDSDCEVITPCCACDQGGMVIAVAKDRRSDYLTALGCEDFPCKSARRPEATCVEGGLQSAKCILRECSPWRAALAPTH